MFANSSIRIATLVTKIFIVFPILKREPYDSCQLN